MRKLYQVSEIRGEAMPSEAVYVYGIECICGIMEKKEKILNIV